MGGRPRVPAFAVCLLFLLLAPSAADAAFPGANGKIGFNRWSDIWIMNPDGSGQNNLTNTQGTQEYGLAWSADGTKIAFPDYSNHAIYVMNADGTQRSLLFHGNGTGCVEPILPTWSPDGRKLAVTCWSNGRIAVVNSDGGGLNVLEVGGSHPAWSADGGKIAFVSGSNIKIMNPDGSGQSDLTSHPTGPVYDATPDWSPDGSRIVFSRNIAGSPSTASSDLYTITRDGSVLTRLTNGNPSSHQYPAWSPNGTKIAFHTLGENFDPRDVYVMDADGSDATNITNNGEGNAYADWQPIPRGYPRPRGATPLRTPLVPSFKQCTNPNNAHGAPLAFESCGPPVQSSDYLTVGAPPQDPANSNGFVLIRASNNADVRFDASITDVRNQGDLSDYTGELQADTVLRITDKNNSPNPDGLGAATVSETRYPVTVPCVPTSSGSIGSTCSVTTSANAITPGSVLAGQSSVWQLEQVEVYDGGADGLASTTSGNTLFMIQGLFVP